MSNAPQVRTVILNDGAAPEHNLMASPAAQQAVGREVNGLPALTTLPELLGRFDSLLFSKCSKELTYSTRVDANQLVRLDEQRKRDGGVAPANGVDKPGEQSVLSISVCQCGTKRKYWFDPGTAAGDASVAGGWTTTVEQAAGARRMGWVEVDMNHTLSRDSTRIFPPAVGQQGPEEEGLSEVSAEEAVDRAEDLPMAAHVPTQFKGNKDGAAALLLQVAHCCTAALLHSCTPPLHCPTVARLTALSGCAALPHCTATALPHCTSPLPHCIRSLCCRRCGKPM